MQTKIEFFVKQSDNHFELYKRGDSQRLLFGNWSMILGKYKAEIFGQNDELIYSIKRKFSFWKWNMSYFIRNVTDKNFVLKAKNKWHSIYKMTIGQNEFQIKLHRGRKKSVFKNEEQIAIIDESFVEVFYQDMIKIITNDQEFLKEIFLVMVCLKIGDEPGEGISFDFGNIGRMEPIDKSWEIEKSTSYNIGYD